MRLTINDYIIILKHYGLPVSKRSVKILKKRVNKLLIGKLCRCIKAVKKNERKSIAICTKSIFTNRNLKRGRFTCKKRASITLTKKRKIRFRKKYTKKKK